MMVHASMAPYKPEQKHNGQLFPECSGSGDEDLGTAAIRAILQANPPHLFPLRCLVIVFSLPTRSNPRKRLLSRFISRTIEFNSLMGGCSVFGRRTLAGRLVQTSPNL
jgi:hypothetical protein